LGKSLLWSDTIGTDNRVVPIHLIQAMITKTATCVYFVNNKRLFRTTIGTAHGLYEHLIRLELFLKTRFNICPLPTV
jgi:fructose/tagatose bisphosphate aldolase